MNVGGSGVDLVGLYTLALLLNLAAVLWAAGVAMRFRTMQAGPVMQLPVFVVLFFAPVYVPLSLLQGWIHGVATVQPADARASSPGAASSRASRPRSGSPTPPASRWWCCSRSGPCAACAAPNAPGRFGKSPPLGGWWRRALPMCSPRAQGQVQGSAARIAQCVPR